MELEQLNVPRTVVADVGSIRSSDGKHEKQRPLDGLHPTASPMFGRANVTERKYEKFWHRAAAHLCATGMSRNDVAKACDVSPHSVGQLMREGWFQENVLEIMAERGSQDILTLFKGEAMRSLATLIELRDSAAVPPAVRADISKNVLDRYLGKPMQRTEVTSGPVSGDPVAEAERLERENKMLGGVSVQPE